jgi:ectoine hydroxylase-related dioxygenase (phytanoyl-CoA dioxygenase family)
VPGSHRWTDGPRASGCTPLPTEAFQADFAPRAVTVPLAAGEALVYDPGLVHGSPPNPTGAARVAVGVALAPEGAPLVHVHQRAPGAYCAYQVDVAYHLDQGLMHEPRGYPEVPVWGRVVVEDDIARALAIPPTAR